MPSRGTDSLYQHIRQIGAMLVMSVVMSALDIAGWTGGVRSVLEQVLAPLDTVAQVSIEVVSTPQKAYVSWRSSAARIASLEERLSVLAAQISDLEQLKTQNRELSEALELAEPPQTSALAATIIDTQEGARINKGSRDGIVPGLVVTTPAGTLVGHIDAVGAYTSTIQALADPGSAVSVRIVGTSTGGIATGDGFRVVMTEVLQADPLEVGDIVITTGAEGIYPEGVVIGQVTELVGDPSDVTKSAIIDLFSQNSQTGLILRTDQSQAAE